MTTQGHSLLHRQLDEYRIDQLLDEGTTARMYRAFDVKLQRHVALRVITPPFRTDPEYTERFLREAQTLAQLEHPNIVQIYRAGEFQGLYYLAMQYVEGADVAWLIEDYKQYNEVMPLEDILQLACDIGSALDYMHSRGLVHREISPRNIIVDPSGRAKLTYIGRASISAEQGAAPDEMLPQNDLYALGVTLFEMLTGEAPFTADPPADPALQHNVRAVPRPSQVNRTLTAAFDEVVLRCLESDPQKRYATGAEICAALKRAAAVWQPNPAPQNDARRHSLLHVPDKVAHRLHAGSAPGAPSHSAGTARPAAAISSYGRRTFRQNMNASLLWLVGSVTACLTLILGMVVIILLLLASRNGPLAAPGAETALTNLPQSSTPLPSSTVESTATPVSQSAASAGPTLSATPTSTPPPALTVIVVGLTTAQPTASPTPSGPPTDRLTVPPHSARLGEFAVEQYCNRQGYGVILTNGQTDWACTNRRTRSIEFILGPSDFDAICRERYNNPDAFAIRDQQKRIQAYNWSCYVFTAPEPPTAIGPLTPVTPSTSSLIPVKALDWLALVNISNAPVSLGSIEFRRGDRILRSSDWGVTVLIPGECLRIARAQASAELPANCNRAFDYAGSEEARRFWLDGEGELYIDIGAETRFVVQ